MEKFMLTRKMINVALLASVLWQCSALAVLTHYKCSKIMAHYPTYSSPQDACAAAWCNTVNSGMGGAANSCSVSAITFKGISKFPTAKNPSGIIQCSVNATCQGNNQQPTLGNYIFYYTIAGNGYYSVFAGPVISNQQGSLSINNP
jgi:hypothetical protein